MTGLSQCTTEVASERSASPEPRKLPQASSFTGRAWKDKLLAKYRGMVNAGKPERRAREPDSTASAVVTSKSELGGLSLFDQGKGIRDITLDGFDFDDDCLALLAKKFPDLESIRLGQGCVEITDTGLFHLHDLALKHLELPGTSITDLGIGSLVCTNTSLKRLRLDDCHGISEQIFSHLAGTKIETLGLRNVRMGTIDEWAVRSIVGMKELNELDIRDGYSDCSESAITVLRAMLDTGFKSDGIRGRAGGSKLEKYARDLVKSLFHAGRIRHDASRIWAESTLLNIQPKTGLLMRPVKSLVKDPVAEYATGVATKIAGELATAATQSEVWQRKEELAKNVVSQFRDGLTARVRERYFFLFPSDYEPEPRKNIMPGSWVED